jgi:hypothetical protein
MVTEFSDCSDNPAVNIAQKTGLRAEKLGQKTRAIPQKTRAIPQKTGHRSWSHQYYQINPIFI